VAVGNENYGFIYLSYKTTSMRSVRHNDDDYGEGESMGAVGEWGVNYVGRKRITYT
jgi:hypothetical protein